LALNLSFSASLGLLPVTLSLKTAGCGIKNPGDQMEAERNSELLLLVCQSFFFESSISFASVLVFGNFGII
jgi:hypothetical protein